MFPQVNEFRDESEALYRLMQIAQCLSGTPEQPPAPETRFLQRPR